MCDIAKALRSQHSARALAWVHESSNDAQQRALPRPIVAEHNVKAPGREARRDPAQGGEAAKEFHELIEDDDGRVGWRGFDQRGSFPHAKLIKNVAPISRPAVARVSRPTLELTGLKTRRGRHGDSRPEDRRYQRIAKMPTHD
jgi:hypothetical protein